MTVFLWAGFIAFVLTMLVLDLGVFHPKAQKMSVEESFGWTLFWIILSLIFNVGIYFLYEQNVFQIGEQIGFRMAGKEAALKFFTGPVLASGHRGYGRENNSAKGICWGDQEIWVLGRMSSIESAC